MKKNALVWVAVLLLLVNLIVLALLYTEVDNLYLLLYTQEDRIDNVVRYMGA